MTYISIDDEKTREVPGLVQQVSEYARIRVHFLVLLVDVLTTCFAPIAILGSIVQSTFVCQKEMAVRRVLRNDF